MSTGYTPLTVSFDDGTTVTVTPKSRDLVRAEECGVDFTEDSQPKLRAMNAVAFAALGRMARAGEIDPDLVPASFEAFLDSVDVDPEEDGEPDPKS